MESQGHYPRKKYRLSTNDVVTATIKQKNGNLIGEIKGSGFKNLTQIQTYMANMFGQIGNWIIFECETDTGKLFSPNVIMCNRKIKI